jgi:transcriptional regulator with XRE-family HTH domain
MEPDWGRLGDELGKARVGAGLTQVQVAERAGVTRTPIQAIERGGPFRRITGTMRAFAQIVGWAEGSVEAVLQGGEPTLLQRGNSAADARPTSAAEESRLPLRVREELRDGEILDHGVFDLTPEGSDAQIIVVVKGKSGASRDEILRYLEAWKRTERQLRRSAEAGGAEPDS